MSRKFIATILAASLAVTSISATPAAAGDDNLKKFLLGAGTLLIIGSALENGKAQVVIKDKDDKYAHGYGHGYGYKKYKKKKRRISKVLPRYCLRRIETRRGDVRMFGKRCLQRNYRYADWLPQDCKIRVKTWRHGHRVTRVGYKPRCLRHYGYRVEGGRRHY